MRTSLGWLTAFLAASAATATGCFLGASDDAQTSPSSVIEAKESGLRALVALEGGCTAVKVGPKHLLLAARCVTNKSAYAVGKTLRFRAISATLDARAEDAGAEDAQTDASPTKTPTPKLTDAGTDASAASDASDASDDAAAAADASGDAGDAGSDARNGLEEEVIAQVQIHPSYLAKCGTGACELGRIGGGDVADVALIILARELTEIPSAAIDLDPVTAGDPVLVLGYGCEAARTPSKLHARETTAASAQSVIHAGSPYKDPELAATLATSYVATLGPASKATELGLCGDADFGAPLLRAKGTAVIGVNSNITFAVDTRSTPTTNSHARVDLGSRFDIGSWLGKLGAETTRTCSTTTEGCPKQPDAGSPAPDAEAGSTEPPPVIEPAPENESPPPTTGPRRTAPTVGPDDESPKSDSGGCSASPSAPLPSGLGIIAVAVAAAFVARRRRR
jgi:MYXO-CTERM domain-containing protein